MAKRLLLILLVATILLAGCDDISANTTTDQTSPTPTVAPNAVLGSSLKAFQNSIGDFQPRSYDNVYTHQDINLFATTNVYYLEVTNNLVDYISIKNLGQDNNANGKFCDSFILEDAKVIESSSTDMNGGKLTLYQSAWLAKQFPASMFLDSTVGGEFGTPVANIQPGTFSENWWNGTDITSTSGACELALGKYFWKAID